MGETPLGPPTDDEVLIFGKWAGQTFLTTATEQYKYCQWIIATVENPYSDGGPSPQLLRFALYLNRLERKLESGVEDPNHMDYQSSEASTADGLHML